MSPMPAGGRQQADVPGCGPPQIAFARRLAIDQNLMPAGQPLHCRMIMKSKVAHQMSTANLM